MRVSIDVPSDIAKSMHAGRKLTIAQDRGVLRIVRAAIISNLPTVHYTDNDTMIEMPSNAVCVRGKISKLMPSETKMLHFLLANFGAWFDENLIYSTCSTPPWCKTAAYTAIYRLRRKVAPHLEHIKRKREHRFYGDGELTLYPDHDLQVQG